MSWSDMKVSGLTSVIQGVGSYIVAKKQAADDKRWRDYNNAMTNLQNAQNQNTITTNENLAIERSAEQAYQIRKSEYITKASAEVQAAATGTTGNSVDMVLFDIGRNAADADAKRLMDLEAQVLGFNNQRVTSNMQTAASIDYRVTPTPSLTSSLLMTGADLTNQWNKAGRPSIGGGVSTQKFGTVPIPAERRDTRL